MKIILGIIGKNGSGKTTVTNYLKNKYQAVSFRFSDPLKDILSRLHLPDSRANFQTLSTSIRQNFGDDILSKVIVEDVKKSNNKIIITEGIRRPTDTTYLKTIIGFNLLAITAEQKLRYNRITARVEKSGDQSKTWKQFLAEENQEAEQKIDAIAAEANFKIDNNGTLKNLYNQVDELVQKLNQ